MASTKSVGLPSISAKEHLEGTYRNRPGFNQTFWDTMQQRGMLGNYIGAMEQGTFDNIDMSSYLNNERDIVMHESGTQVNFDRAYTQFLLDAGVITDDDTWNEGKGIEGVEGSTSWSTRDFISWQLEQERQQTEIDNNLFMEEQARLNMNAGMRVLGDIGAFVGNLGIGAYSTIEGLVTAPFNIAGAIQQGATDGKHNFMRDVDLPSVAMKEAMFNFERKYTNTRTAYGNYTGAAARIAMSVADSIGRMLPMIALGGLGKIGAFGAFGKTGTFALLNQASFYVGMLGNDLTEKFRNEQYRTASGWSVLAGSIIGTGLEFAVERALAGALGRTGMDAYVFGGTAKTAAASKITVRAGVKLFLKDIGQELLEEVLQDFSRNLTDLVMHSMDKDYAMPQYGAQEFFDTIIATAISTSVLGTSRHMLSNNFRIQGKKLGFFKSLSAQNILENMNYQTEQVMQDTTLSSQQKQDIYNTIFSGYVTITNLYGQMGTERAAKVQSLLEALSVMEESGVKQLRSLSENMYIQQVFKDIESLNTDNSRKVIKATKKLSKHEIKILQDNGMTNVEDVITNADDIKNITGKAKASMETLLRDSGKPVAITRNGNQVVQTSEMIFVPRVVLETGDLKNIRIDKAYQQIQNAFIEAMNKPVNASKFAAIKEFAKKFFGKTITDKQLFANLTLNTDFFMALVFNAQQDNIVNKSHLKLLGNLHQFIEKATYSKVELAILEQFTKKLQKDMSKAVMQLAIMHSDVAYFDLDILTSTDKKTVLDELARRQQEVATTPKVVKGKITSPNGSEHEQISTYGEDTGQVSNPLTQTAKDTTSYIPPAILEQWKGPLTLDDAITDGGWKSGFLLPDGSTTFYAEAPSGYNSSTHTEIRARLFDLMGPDGQMQTEYFNDSLIEIAYHMPSGGQTVSAIRIMGPLTMAQQIEVKIIINNLLNNSGSVEVVFFDPADVGSYVIVRSNETSTGTSMWKALVGKAGGSMMADIISSAKPTIQPSKPGIVKAPLATSEGSFVKASLADNKRTLVPFLKKTLSESEYAMMSVDDMVRNPKKFLNDTTIKDIIQVKGELSFDNVFTYIKNKLLKSKDNITLLLHQRGMSSKTTVIFGDFTAIAKAETDILSKMNGDLNNTWLEILIALQTDNNGIAMLSEFFNDLIGKAKYTKVVPVKTGVTFYSAANNTIYIDTTTTISNADFRNKLLHEFVHTQQATYGTIQGTSYDLVFKDRTFITQFANWLQKIDKQAYDIMMSKTPAAKEKFVNNFAYEATGEMDAYLRHTQQITYVPFYTYIKGGKRWMVTPFGTFEFTTKIGESAIRASKAKSLSLQRQLQEKIERRKKGIMAEDEVSMEILLEQERRMNQKLAARKGLITPEHVAEIKTGKRTGFTELELEVRNKPGLMELEAWLAIAEKTTNTMRRKWIAEVDIEESTTEGTIITATMPKRTIEVRDIDPELIRIFRERGIDKINVKYYMQEALYIDETTFQFIKENFYPNVNIKTYDQLSEIMMSIEIDFNKWYVEQFGTVYQKYLNNKTEIDAEQAKLNKVYRETHFDPMMAVYNAFWKGKNLNAIIAQNLYDLTHRYATSANQVQRMNKILNTLSEDKRENARKVILASFSGETSMDDMLRTGLNAIQITKLHEQYRLALRRVIRLMYLQRFGDTIGLDSGKLTGLSVKTLLRLIDIIKSPIISANEAALFGLHGEQTGNVPAQWLKQDTTIPEVSMKDVMSFVQPPVWGKDAEDKQVLQNIIPQTPKMQKDGTIGFNTPNLFQSNKGKVIQVNATYFYPMIMENYTGKDSIGKIRGKIRSRINNASTDFLRTAIKSVPYLDNPNYNYPKGYAEERIMEEAVRTSKRGKPLVFSFEPSQLLVNFLPANNPANNLQLTKQQLHNALIRVLNNPITREDIRNNMIQNFDASVLPEHDIYWRTWNELRDATLSNKNIAEVAHDVATEAYTKAIETYITKQVAKVTDADIDKLNSDRINYFQTKYDAAELDITDDISTMRPDEDNTIEAEFELREQRINYLYEWALKQFPNNDKGIMRAKIESLSNVQLAKQMQEIAAETPMDIPMRLLYINEHKIKGQIRNRAQQLLKFYSPNNPDIPAYLKQLFKQRADGTLAFTTTNESNSLKTASYDTLEALLQKLNLDYIRMLQRRNAQKESLEIIELQKQITQTEASIAQRREATEKWRYEKKRLKETKVVLVRVDGTTVTKTINTNAPKVWLDLLAIDSTVGMPASEKVRMSKLAISEWNENKLVVSAQGFNQQAMPIFDNLILNFKDTTILELAEFLLQDAVSIEQTDEIYEVYKFTTLGIISERIKTGEIIASMELAQRIENALAKQARLGGLSQVTWREIIKIVDPLRHWVSTWSEKYGVVLAAKDVEPITNKIKAIGQIYEVDDKGKLTKRVKSIEQLKQDVELINKEVEKLYDKVLAERTKKESDLVRRIFALRSAAMLSSPMTWIRNIMSNTIVTIGNKAATSLGFKLKDISFGSKWRNKVEAIDATEGQYTIHGTNVSTDVANFIDTAFIQSGLLTTMFDGFSNYTAQTLKQHNYENKLTAIIAKSVEHKLNKQGEFKWEGFNKFTAFVYKRLSDNRFIRNGTLSYFGKMLQESYDKGTFTFTGVIDDNVTTVLADAVFMAMNDYMHGQNIASDFEAWILKRGGKIGFYAWKMFMPFARAGFGWFAEGLRYSPFGLAKAVVNIMNFEKYKNKLQILHDEGSSTLPPSMAKYVAYRNLGKGAIGTIAWVIGMLLAAFGFAGIGEEDGKVKLKLGKYRIDITNLFGTSSLAAGIMMIEGASVDGVFNAMNSAAGIWTEGFLLKDIMEMDNYGQGGVWGVMAQTLSAFPSSFIPNFWKLFTQNTRLYKTKTSAGLSGALERFGQDLIPFIYFSPIRTNVYTGEAISRMSIPVLSEITRIAGFEITQYNPSNAEIIARTLGLKKQELTGNYKEGTVDKERLNIVYGIYNRNALNKFTQNKTAYDIDGKTLLYRQMTDEQRTTIFNRIMSQNAQYAKIQMFTSKGWKYYGSAADVARLKALGIINVHVGDKGLIR